MKRFAAVSSFRLPVAEKQTQWQLSCEQAGDATLSSAAAGHVLTHGGEPVRVSSSTCAAR